VGGPWHGRIGDACRIDRSYMGGIERGEHKSALVNILKIVNALGIQPLDFFKALDKPTKRDGSKLP
jgi:transcriptional regulator with XRE-family HTH domain